jgi:hypothetical protein
MCHAGYTAGEGEFNFEYFVGSESSDVSDGVKEEFSLNCEKEEVQDYLRFLLASDYAEKKRKGLKVLYAALGSEYTL